MLSIFRNGSNLYVGASEKKGAVIKKGLVSGSRNQVSGNDEVGGI